MAQYCFWQHFQGGGGGGGGGGVSVGCVGCGPSGGWEGDGGGVVVVAVVRKTKGNQVI